MKISKRLPWLTTLNEAFTHMLRGRMLFVCVPSQSTNVQWEQTQSAFCLLRVGNHAWKRSNLHTTSTLQGKFILRKQLYFQDISLIQWNYSKQSFSTSVLCEISPKDINIATKIGEINVYKQWQLWNIGWCQIGLLSQMTFKKLYHAPSPLEYFPDSPWEKRKERKGSWRQKTASSRGQAKTVLLISISPPSLTHNFNTFRTKVILPKQTGFKVGG